MARHENNRTRSFPNGQNFSRNFGSDEYEVEGNVTSNRLPHQFDDGNYRREAWERIDDQRGNRNFSRKGEPRYSGYYGDANARENQGTNRFGSGRVQDYNDNRYLDSDDNFINQSSYEGQDRNVGRNQAWEGRNMSNFSDDFSRNLDRRKDRFEQEMGFRGKGPKGWRRSDERINEDVCESLYRSRAVDATQIEVNVADGLVTLTGSVPSRTMKREAEDCVEHVMGVSDVRNEIQVRS